MARVMSSTNDRVYRVVVIQKNYYEDKPDIKTVYGPYELPRTAGYVKSYMTNGYWSRSRIVDAWVETAEPSWERIDANK